MKASATICRTAVWDFNGLDIMVFSRRFAYSCVALLAFLLPVAGCGGATPGPPPGVTGETAPPAVNLGSPGSGSGEGNLGSPESSSGNGSSTGDSSPAGS